MEEEAHGRLVLYMLKHMKPKKIYFLCSPNLGILDSWLPVIYSLAKNNQFEFIIIIPNVYTAESIDISNPLVKISSSIFSRIIFKGFDGCWHSSENFQSVKHKLKNHYLYKYISESYLYRYIGDITNKLFKFRKMNLKICRSSLIRQLNFDQNEEVILLYDAYEELKDSWKDVGKEFTDAIKFSLPYSNWILGVEFYPSEKNNNTHPAVIFAYSDKQMPYYNSVFSNSKVVVVGFPRHDQWWINLLRDYSEINANFLKDKYILVVSRPPVSDRFPVKRRLQALIDVHHLSNKYNLKVVVKPHPKEWFSSEEKENNWFEIFGKKNYGKDWIFSNNHLINLAENALFVVCFLSATTPDFVRMNTPVIARYDLSGLQDYDKIDALRDIKGRPVLGYGQFGLELLASNLTELIKLSDSAINNRQEVLESQRVAYNNLFPTLKNSSATVAEHILSFIEQH